MVRLVKQRMGKITLSIGKFIGKTVRRWRERREHDLGSPHRNRNLRTGGNAGGLIKRLRDRRVLGALEAAFVPRPHALHQDFRNDSVFLLQKYDFYNTVIYFQFFQHGIWIEYF